MNKYLILLLFALAQNLEVDDIQTFNVDSLKKIQGKDVVELNIKVGKEFYLRLLGDKSSNKYWKILNSEEIPEALDDFDKKGEQWKFFPLPYKFPKGVTNFWRGFYYFKFKALKPSFNEIVLKLALVHGEKTDIGYIIKINIVE